MEGGMVCVAEAIASNQGYCRALAPWERCTGPFKQGKAAPKFMPISTLL